MPRISFTLRYAPALQWSGMKIVFVFLNLALLVGGSWSVAWPAAGASQRQTAVAGNSAAKSGPAVRVPAESEKGTPREWIAPPGHTIEEIETIERDCFNAVNKEREGRGLRALALDPDLLEVARTYSRRMAEHGFFAHKDPDGNTVLQRAANAGIRWHMLGENLAFERGYVSPTAITIRGWMESPGHRENILEPRFALSAIGVWMSSNDTVYFTELFMKE